MRCKAHDQNVTPIANAMTLKMSMNNHTPHWTCPNCGPQKKGYNEYDDMYTCEECLQAYFPEEVKKPENPVAGWKRINNSAMR